MNDKKELGPRTCPGCKAGVGEEGMYVKYECGSRYMLTTGTFEPTQTCWERRTSALIDELQKASVAIYAAVDEDVAKHISGLMREASERLVCANRGSTATVSVVRDLNERLLAVNVEKDRLIRDTDRLERIVRQVDDFLMVRNLVAVEDDYTKALGHATDFEVQIAGDPRVRRTVPCTLEEGEDQPGPLPSVDDPVQFVVRQLHKADRLKAPTSPLGFNIREDPTLPANEVHFITSSGRYVFTLEGVKA